MRYPADPPTVDEIVAVMRTVGHRVDGRRLRALIVLLWRAGLRISEALALQESDLDRSRGAVLVRRGKGGKRREVGMDRWAWQQVDRWVEIRRRLPTGALLCVIHGPTAGRHWEASAARKQLHHAAAAAGVRRRFAPHQLRHAHAVEMALEGIAGPDSWMIQPRCSLTAGSRGSALARMVSGPSPCSAFGMPDNHPPTPDGCESASARNPQLAVARFRIRR
jgi:integrase